jgi:hypothetical protein
LEPKTASRAIKIDHNNPFATGIERGQITGVIDQIRRDLAANAGHRSLVDH